MASPCARCEGRGIIELPCPNCAAPDGEPDDPAASTATDGRALTLPDYTARARQRLQAVKARA